MEQAKSIVNFNKVEKMARLLLKQSKELLDGIAPDIQDLKISLRQGFILEYEHEEKYQSLIRLQRYFSERVKTLEDAICDDDSIR